MLTTSVETCKDIAWYGITKFCEKLYPWQMSKTNTVTYNSSNGNKFIVHKSDRYTFIFIHTGGLDCLNCGEESVALVNTIYSQCL